LHDPVFDYLDRLVVRESGGVERLEVWCAGMRPLGREMERGTGEEADEVGFDPVRGWR